MARLNPSTTLAQAEARAQTVAAEFKERFPEAYTDDAYTANVVPLRARIVGDVRAPLLVLLGTVATVLLIAALYVANLLLVRAEARQREVAVRTALRAETRRVIQQFVVESTLLTLMGGALGLLVAYGGIDFLRAFNPGGIPRIDQVGIDARVVGVTALIATATGVLMGLVPGIHAVRTDINVMLRDGGRGATGVRGNRLRRVLVVSEMAIAVGLVIGTGLLVRSFARLTDIDLGIASDNVLSMRLDLEAGPRFVTMLLGIFAALALCLAAIGIYGVISHSVAQRTQEIGVRMALGAGSGKVQRLVLRQGLSIALIGVAIGVGGALIATRFLAGMLYGVSATDPVTFAGVAVLLTGVAVLASYLPARRASLIEPTVALRSE